MDSDLPGPQGPTLRPDISMSSPVDIHAFADLPSFTDTTAEREAEFERFTNEGINFFTNRQRERFGPGSTNPLDFHTDEVHINPGLRRIDEIYDVFVEQAGIAITDADDLQRAKLWLQHKRNLTKLSYAAHDGVQDYKVGVFGLPTGDPLDDMRMRDRGPNEIRSAEEAVEYMKEVNHREGVEIFSPRDRYEAYTGIADGTYPTFVPQENTAYQERINEGDHLVKVIDGRVDLMGSAYDPAQFGLEGRGEGMELFFGQVKAIAEALITPDNRVDIQGLNRFSDQQREKIVNQIRGWFKGQIKWAQSRAARTPSEVRQIKLASELGPGLKNTPSEVLNNMDNSIHEVLLAGIFGKSEDSIKQATEESNRADTMSLEQLVDFRGDMARAHRISVARATQTPSQ